MNIKRAKNIFFIGLILIFASGLLLLFDIYFVSITLFERSAAQLNALNIAEYLTLGFFTTGVISLLTGTYFWLMFKFK